MLMAIRSVSNLLLRSNLRCFSRPLASAASSSPSSFTAITIDDKHDFSPASTPTRTTTSTLDLTDHEKLFASVSAPNLLRASGTLQLASMESMVDIGMWVMNSKLMEVDVLREIVVRMVRHTFYEHFCAGESVEEAVRCVSRMSEIAGLRGMLVYGVEHTDDNSACDQNLNRFLQTAESARSLSLSSVSFVVVKITAICPINLLRRVSDLLRWQYKNPSFNLPWKLNTLPIFADSSPLYHTLKEPQPLTPQEELDLQLGHQRLLKIFEKCLEANVPLCIDAEDTWLQPAIDYLTYSSAILYRKFDNPIVYGTMQTYLKDAGERLYLAAKHAEKLGVQVGFKLVRGAYMSSEIKLASSLGYESPIHNNIQETHACFNDCASFMLESIANGHGAVVLATHNVESGQLAVAKAGELGIGKGNQRLEFAQLYGMADALSFGLRNAGFQVSKYMPFGPVDLVMPYLLRRAEENRGLLSASALDRELMRKELWRRLKAIIL